ncbi:hypothetical protein VNI00_007348 [Paramarasmius palmivorus]|uniref:Uncharacterized protein n=1 Tax=Paramarasmius palmivorus TaxID=297713 RepID=A0AAW0D0A4_9AGAR
MPNDLLHYTQTNLQCIDIDVSFLSRPEVELFSSLTTETAPQLTPGSSLAFICEIPLDLYPELRRHPAFQDSLNHVLAHFDRHDFRAMYILQIATLAMYRHGKGFQEAIGLVRCNGVIREMLRPAEHFSAEQIYVVRMVLSSAVYFNLAVEYIACFFMHGERMGIKYPVCDFEDWDGNEKGYAGFGAEV